MGFAILVFAIGIAVIINIFFKRIDIPVIIGYIVTGVIIVYAFDLRVISASEDLSKIAEFGIVFLMFMIGLEFSFTRIKAMKQEVLTFGSLQMILTTGIFFLINYYIFQFNGATSIIIASAFSLSSTAIVLKSFEENKVMGTGYGKKALGILIMQDIAVIPILLMVAMLGNKETEFAPLLIKTVVSAIVVLFILFIPGKFLATKILKFAANTHMDEIFMGTVLFIVLGAALLSEYFEFSHSLGAFIAGMVISSSDYKHQVEADLTHFRDIFLGLFFVTVGMQVDLEFLMQHFFIIGLFLVLVMSLKVGIIFTILKLLRREAKTALKTALSLCQIGEFSFAIFLISQQAGLLQTNEESKVLQGLIEIGVLQKGFSATDMNQILTLMVILSMIATPFVLKNLRKITLFFLPKVAKSIGEEERKIQEYTIKGLEAMRDHIVVCGYGTFGQEIVQWLKEHHMNYVAVDYNLARVEKGLKQGDHVIFGNVAQKGILEHLSLKDSRAVIIAVDDTGHLKHICQMLLEEAPECNIIAKVTTEEEEMQLGDMPLHYVINEKKEIAKILAHAALAPKEL